MKILVTGGAGFIGSNIVDALVELKNDVVIIDNLSTGKESNINRYCKFYRHDIRDECINEIFEIEKPDVLIHNAAQISVPNSIKNPMEDASINIMGTVNILEAARKSGVKKIIYPASAAIYGEPKYLPIDEKHPLNMLSGYGITKHTVEHYLEVYKRLYGINYTVLRYSNVYGPKQDSSGEGGVVAIFCNKLINGETPYIYGDGEQIRDFIYINDVVKANLISISSDSCGIYNVCTNIRVTINSLFDCIKDILHKNISAIHTEPREGDIECSYMSYDRILNDLGWKPQFSLEQGIRETIEYYKQMLKM